MTHRRPLRRPLVAACLVGGVVFLVFAAASAHSTSGSAPLLDVYARCSFSRSEARVSTGLGLAWSPISSTAYGIAVGVTLARRGLPRLGLACALAAPLSTGLCELAKLAVAREYAGRFSFPSAHAAAAACVVVASLAAAHAVTGRLRSVLGAAAVLTAALCLALLYFMVRTCVHLPNDVVGGVALGLVTTAGLGLLAERLQPQAMGGQRRAPRVRTRS